MQKTLAGVVSTLPGVATHGDLHKSGLAESVFNRFARRSFPNQRSAKALQSFRGLMLSHNVERAYGSYDAMEHNLMVSPANRAASTWGHLAILYAVFLRQQCVMFVGTVSQETPGASIKRADGAPLNLFEVERLYKTVNPIGDRDGFNFSTTSGLREMILLNLCNEEHGGWFDELTSRVETGLEPRSYVCKKTSCPVEFVDRQDFAPSMQFLREMLGQREFLGLIRSCADWILRPHREICEEEGLQFGWREFCETTPCLTGEELEVVEQSVSDVWPATA